MIALGLGFTSRASAGDIVAAIDATLAAYRLERQDVEVVSTADFKRSSQCFTDAIAGIDLKPRYCSGEALRRYNAKTLSHSEHSLTSTGIACVSEAAALSAVGVHGKLLGPRHTFGQVTCAIAVEEAP